MRKPIGIESLNRAIEIAKVNLKTDSISLLDVGCGTGNYMMVVKESVHKWNGLEFNQGMID